MSNMMPPPRMTHLSSSDDEISPLREINPTHVQNRPSLAPFDHIDNASATSSSDNENNWKHTPPLTDRADAMKIRSAVKRASSIRSSGINGNTSRIVRRRSPSAATAGSPTTGDMFAAGHVRRMVIGKESKENEWRVGVLSPRVTGVVTASKVSSGGRRVTMTVTPMGTGERTAHRVSSISGSNHAQEQAHGPRSSLMPGGKGTWRWIDLFFVCCASCNASWAEASLDGGALDGVWRLLSVWSNGRRCSTRKSRGMLTWLRTWVWGVVF